jgi:hypothetical protein
MLNCHTATCLNHTKLTPALHVATSKRILNFNELGVSNIRTCYIVYVIHSLIFMCVFALRGKWKMGDWTGLIWLRIGAFDGHL